MKNIQSPQNCAPQRGNSSKPPTLFFGEGSGTFTLLFLVAMLGFGPNSATAQSLLCPWPAANPGDPSVPLSIDWKAELPIGPKIIPVVVHLIGGSSSGLTPAQVSTAISQLNADFNSVNLDWDIEFRLARFSPDGECTDGVDSHPALFPSGNFKILTRWPNANYLNIWVVNTVNGDPQILGTVSAIPTLFKENATCDGVDRTDRIAGQNANFDEEDGVVIKKDEFYPNNAGRHTLTHEVGHWLNLRHVHQRDPNSNACPYWTDCHPESESATNGDFIEDTNPQEEVNTYNPADCSIIGLGKCSNVPLLANLDNFMGYAHPCQNTFTQGQREWMYSCMMLNRSHIWSDENLQCTGVLPSSNDISGHLIWDMNTVPSGFVQVPQEIHILANSSLTVGAGVTVQFCENAKLVVDQGGHLILNGTLTNTCYGKMWAGVEVRGSGMSNNSTQWPNNMGVYSQGRLSANAGSVIQNALTAIFAGGAGGGIVRCTGTTFLNNRKAVQFEPFENHFPTPSTPVTSNSSRFTLCNFTTDAGYIGDNLSIYEPNDQKKFVLFADLQDVRGIRFSGCNFANLRTDYLIKEDFGHGILSTESGFIVENWCTANLPSPAPCPLANQVKSTFRNLYEGIFVGVTDVSGEIPKYYLIQSAFFQGCWTGIRSEKGSRGVIVQNTFEIGNVPVAFPPDIAFQGVLLESGHTTFTLQENTFRLGHPILPDIIQAGFSFIGSRAYEIGEEDNLIRKNYYTNLTIGNESVGDNANPQGTKGLRYICNENQNNNTHDFKVTNGKGVRSLQGEMTIGPVLGLIPAGNVFSHINLQESDFRNTAVNNIQYIHRLVVPETPMTFTVNKVVLQMDIDDPQCGSNYCYPLPCRSDEQINQAKQAIIAAKSEYNTVYASYTQQPNGPNAAAQRNTMTGLQAVMQDNTFAVLQHIEATEGSLSDYRYWLGYLDAYETDLALAKNYIGAGEYAQASTLLNAMPSKHGLSGDNLSAFNDYRAVLNILQAHLQSGGDKYSLPSAGINAIKWYAENNSFAQVRGQAKAMLAMYGILYPPESVPETGNRSAVPQASAVVNIFTLSPNPANESVWLGIGADVSKKHLTGQASLFSVHGQLLFQQNIVGGETGIDIPLAQQPNGYYFVKVRLSNGEFATLPLVIAH
jgi:hypothetical protein